MSGFPVAWPLTWAVETLVASTFLMLAVLLLRRPVRRAFGPDIAYALWALPVLRIALPPLPESWTRATVAPVVQASERITILFAEPIGETAAAAPVSWAATAVPALAMMWLVGAAVFIGGHVLSHRRFCRRMLADAATAEDLAGGVRMIETAAASGPLAFGVWRRYVAFPRDFAERYEAEERELALAHELGHHARGDLIANWIALVVLGLHWFNPVAWRAFRAFRADQEIANDARVLGGMTPIARHTYACAIIKAAHPTALGGAVSATCHLHTINDLKGRLRMLTTNKTSRARLLTGTGALALFVTAGLALTASGAEAVAKVRTTVESATGVTLASLDQVAPVPPVPPVPSVPPVAGEHRSDHVAKVDGKVVHESHFASDKDGTTRGTVQADGKVMAFVPVTSGDCGKDDGSRRFVIQKPGNPPTTVICTDRITQAAMAGALTAADGDAIEHKALTAALDGLRAARAGIAGNRGMSAEARDEALKGIDEGIREVEDDLAHPGKDEDS